MINRIPKLFPNFFSCCTMKATRVKGINYYDILSTNLMSRNLLQSYKQAMLRSYKGKSVQAGWIFLNASNKY